MRLMDANTEKLFGLKYKLVCRFKLRRTWSGVNQEFVYDKDK
jgi:hypothetical protein